jgi:hypothetical protein
VRMPALARTSRRRTPQISQKCLTKAYTHTLVNNPLRRSLGWGMTMLPEGIELALQERRSMEQALVDLQATYAETPSPRLSRMISLLGRAARPEPVPSSRRFHIGAASGNPGLTSALLFSMRSHRGPQGGIDRCRRTASPAR